jgi:hypothetical protein
MSARPSPLKSPVPAMWQPVDALFHSALVFSVNPPLA